MGYIYKISNDINNKVYVGQTNRSISIRWQEHCKNYQTIDYPIYRAMRKYGINHFFIEQIEECNSEDINEKEKFWIKFYDSYKNGYNATLGGEGYSIIDKGQILLLWNKGYTIKDITNLCGYNRRTISFCLKNNGITQEDIDKRAYERKIKNSKKVYQIDKDTNQIINTFSSIKEAARFVNGVHSRISEVCNGKHITAYNYKWKFVDNIDKEKS